MQQFLRSITAHMTELTGSWDVLQDISDRNCGHNSNQYSKELINNSKLVLLQPGKVLRAYDSNIKELALTQMFLFKSFIRAMIVWTNINFMNHGKDKIGLEKFYGFLGLEIAMSQVKMTSISEY